MAGRGISRLLAEAAPLLRRGLKAPLPSAAAAATAARQLPPSRSLTATARAHEEGCDSEKFWRMVFVVGSVAFACRVVQVFSDKYADLRRAEERNASAWAESREKDEEIRRLLKMLEARDGTLGKDEKRLLQMLEASEQL